MNQDLDQVRAERARAGSRRKRDLQAAGMSPESTNRLIAAEQRSRERWDEQRKWVTDRFPDLPEVWISMFMDSLSRARRAGIRNPSYDQLVESLRRRGFPVDGDDEIPAVAK